MDLFRFLRQRKADERARNRRQSERERLRSERDEWRGIGQKPRLAAAWLHVKGEGIEIGGLHRPLRVFHGAHVRLVNRAVIGELRKFHPEQVNAYDLRVDLVDDAETLVKLEAASCDFVIVNRMLVRLRNPIGAIENYLRVLRTDGTLLITHAEKSASLDAGREITSFEHVKRDHFEGPQWSERQHYEEWVKTVEAVRDDDARDKRIAALLADRAEIRFHVWTAREILELIFKLQRDFGMRFSIEFFARTGSEVVTVLRKEG